MPLLLLMPLAGATGFAPSEGDIASGALRNLPVDLERDVIKLHDVETGLWQIDLTVGSSTRGNCCGPCETLGPEMYDQYENPSKAFAH